MRAVNLIPAEQRGGMSRGPARSQGAAYAVLALVGGLAILALLYGMAHRKISSRTGQLASIAAQAQQSAAEAAQLAPYTSFIALREQRVQTVLGLVDARFDWAHALHELGRVLPRDAAISSLTGTVGSASSGGSSAAKSASTGGSSTPPGSVPTIALTGCATSQTEVALTLNRLRLIDGVSEVTLASSTKTAASAGGGSGKGECPGGNAAFTAHVVFAPLPDQTAFSATASTGASR